MTADRISDHDQFGGTSATSPGNRNASHSPPPTATCAPKVRELELKVAWLENIAEGRGEENERLRAMNRSLGAPVPPRPTAPNPGVPEKRPRHPKDAA